LTALALAARADEGCSKDTDCKGERICVQRQCVHPEACFNRDSGSNSPTWSSWSGTIAFSATDN